MEIINTIMTYWANIMKKTTNFMISSEENLNQNIEKNKKLIIIFGHPKCHPCQKIMLRIPFIIFRFARKWYKIKFCNIKENHKIAENLGISHTPCLIEFIDKKKWKIIKDTNEVFNFLWIKNK